jgi:thioredoxin 1
MTLRLPICIAITAGAVLPMCGQVPVPALDPAGLTRILKSGKWTVIEFGGPTCIPCQRMQSVLGELQQQFGTRALIRNFYVTEYPNEARQHKVMAMPTQVVFDPAGKEVVRHIGFWTKPEFLAALATAGLK